MIADDDATAGLRVGIGDASVWEGDVGTTNPAKVWVTLSSRVSGAVPVSVRLTVTPAGTTPGVDHKPLKSRTLVFEPGQWRKAVTLAVRPDGDQESGESVSLVLSDPTAGLTITRDTGSFQINDDD